MRPTVATFRRTETRRRERPTWARFLIRRLRIAASSAVLWALEGYEDGEGNTESDGAEVYAGIGFFARPKAGSRAEAIVVKVGSESGHPAIVATRDQDALGVAGIGDADGAQIHNTVAIVRVRADGTVEAGAHGGPFVPLATKADIDALATWAGIHAHPSNGAPPSTSPPAAAGTVNLRAR